MDNLNTSGFSRRSFLKKSAVAAGALALISLEGPAFVFGKELMQQANSDLDMANFEYGLEALAIGAYTAAAKTNLLDKPVLDIALKFVDQHTQHQKAWESEVTRLGGKPQALAIGKFPELKSQTDILMFAKTLEEVAVGSYYGAIGKFQDASLANIAASIMPIEAQHVAVYASALKQNPLPDSFVKGTPEADITKIATSLQVGPAGQATAAGQGGAPATAPSSMPASGVGSAAKDDYTGGIIAGTLAAIGAAAAGALAFRKRNQQQSNEE